MKISYFNLLVEFGDILPRSDQLLLLIFALGGSDIPVALLKSVRGSQRRWTQEGEIKTTTATDFGLPSELVQFMSDDNCLAQACARPEITKHELEDGTPTWSIRPEVMIPFPDTLSPQTKEDLASMALRLICFACPPCFEGNTTWYDLLNSMSCLTNTFAGHCSSKRQFGSYSIKRRNTCESLYL